MRPTLVATTLALLLPLLAPSGAAAANDALVLEGDHVWEGEDLVFDRDVVVANGSNLTIVGVRVSFANTSLTIDPDASLIVRSLPGDPAALTSDSDGWRLIGRGSLTLEGRKEAPIEIANLSGSAGAVHKAVSVTGGFSMAHGALLADHVRLSNYTSGMVVGGNATTTLRNVTFESPRGLGLVVTGAALDIQDSDFRGAGAMIYVGVPSGPVTLRNLSFEAAPRPILLRGVNGAIVENVSATDADVCLDLVGWNRAINVSDFSCSRFGTMAMRLGFADNPGSGTPDVVVRRLHAWTDAPTSETGIFANEPRGLALHDSILGPMPSNAITITGAKPKLVNVTFVDVGGFNVFVSKPPTHTIPEVPRVGVSGKEGWLRVVEPMSVLVLAPNGLPAQGALVSVVEIRNGTVVHESTTDHAGTLRPFPLDVLRIGPDGVEQPERYALRAVQGESRLVAALDGYVPDGEPLVLHLKTAEEAPVPMVPLIVCLLAIGLAHLLRPRVRV